MPALWVQEYFSCRSRATALRWNVFAQSKRVQEAALLPRSSRLWSSFSSAHSSKRCVEVEIQTPRFAAPSEINRDRQCRFRPDKKTSSIPRMKSVEREVFDSRRHLAFIEEESPIECGPDAVSIFKSQS